MAQRLVSYTLHQVFRVLVLIDVTVIIGKTLDSSLTVPLFTSIHIPSPQESPRGVGLYPCDDQAFSSILSKTFVSDIVVQQIGPIWPDTNSWL